MMMMSSPSRNSNNSSSSNNKRQLVRPSQHIPWSVEVVSAVPKILKDKLHDDNDMISGATHGRWSCVVFGNGIVYIWQIHGASNLSEQLDIPHEYVRLYFPDMDVVTTTQQQQQQGNDGNNNSGSFIRPLVALSSSSTSSSSSSSMGDHHHHHHDSVLLYLAHPITGWLIVRKVTRRDLQSSKIGMLQTTTTTSSSSSSTMVKVKIDNTTQPTFASDEGETITSLTTTKTSSSSSSSGGPAVVVVGTSRGQLYWVTHITVPGGLHVQRVEADTPSFRWSTLWFGGGGGGGGYGITNTTTTQHNDIIVLPMMTKLDFITLSVQSIIYWRVETTIAAGHNVLFHPTKLGSLSSVLREYQQDWTIQAIHQAELSFNGKYVHCIVEGKTKTGEEEDRLYWIVIKVQTPTGPGSGGISIARTHWLSRFALPREVQVLGLVACENDNAYASFATSANSGAVIVMVLLDEEENVVQEVDLPPRHVPGLVPNTMERDTVTHGCYMMAKSGLGIRARLLPQQQQDSYQSKRPRLGEMLYESKDGHHTPSSSSSAKAGLVTLQTLVSHLRSYFWECYQDPTIERPMPPSLKLASPSDLEQAVCVVAVELQHRCGDSSSYAIAIQWHVTFVKLVQDGGLYRSLSDAGKWKLFGVGQELAVFGDLAHSLMNQYKLEDIDWLDTLRSHGVADWLLSVQKTEIESRWPHSDVWYDVLGIALNTALQFREEYLDARYDVPTDHRLAEPLWMSHPSLQDMLIEQMKYWKGNNNGVPLALIESVVKAALLSFSESMVMPSSSSPEQSLIVTFEGVKRRAISLLRMVNEGNDELAFDLCIQYRFFEGLCEISVAHEKKHDAASFSLDPLFGKMEGTDLLNGLTFPQFVLSWHAKKGLYGHVINYGRHSAVDLDLIMNQNDQLRKYRWIPAIRQSNFEDATKFCLENCNEDKSLKNTHWATSLAKLTNTLVTSRSAQGFQRQIEYSMELVKAQQMLTGQDDDDDNKHADEPLMSPIELVERAIAELEDSYDKEKQVRMAMVGLAVCNAMDDDKVALEYTARIWAQCLLCDLAKWTDWAVYGTGDSLAEVRQEALETTVFGRILEECRRGDGSMNKVTYGRHVETAVLDRVRGEEDRESFTRVLRCVATPTDSMKMQSLMVSSF